MSTVYSEYLLYEPIARIAKSQGYDVRCEVPVINMPKERGDYKRIDFQFTKDNSTIVLEVKWSDKTTCPVTKDIEKLKAFASQNRFLIVFGRGKTIAGLKAKSNGRMLSPSGKMVGWNSGKTNYAARWFKV
jgi:hypothetical protein